MNKKYIISNWKMLPRSLAEAQEIMDSVSDFLLSHSASWRNGDSTLVFCPPFVFIEEVSKWLNASSLSGHAFLGAQDVAVDDSGALTGEIPGPMLQKLGVQYVIIGHSERRWKLGESDDIVNKKLKAALRNDMTPIVCLGERVRDDSFKEFLKEQVEKTFVGLNHDELEKCIIAYEPVWAISSNPGAMPDSPEESIKAIKTIWGELNSLGGGETWLPTLYGGSVNSNNVADFLGQKEIDGVLVGGASVNKEEFVRILKLV